MSSASRKREEKFKTLWKVKRAIFISTEDIMLIKFRLKVLASVEHFLFCKLMDWKTDFCK